MHRVLRPGGLACMAFTNRCFPTKVRRRAQSNALIRPSHRSVARREPGTPLTALIWRQPCMPSQPFTMIEMIERCSTRFEQVVPAWKRPFTEPAHAKLVGNYFHFSADWTAIEVADISPDGWTGQRDPMIVVMGRKL